MNTLKVLAVALLLSSCSTRASIKWMTREDYKDEWPLTLNAGHLTCLRGSAVIFNAKGQTYAVNGVARGMAINEGWRDIDLIWESNPDILGTKKSIDLLIKEGLKLCN